MPRPYRLGRRTAAVNRTHAAILDAARDLVAHGRPAGLAAVARHAGVSRSTVYNRFRSRRELLAALAPAPTGENEVPAGPPREMLRDAFARRGAAWAVAPALYRRLEVDSDSGQARLLAEELARADALRPGCSVREAEDVLAALLSFAVFDRLHRDGRRTTGAVADVLTRLAAGLLA